MTTTSQQLLPSAILRAAARLIEERWLSDGVTGANGTMCAAATIGWCEQQGGCGIAETGALDYLVRVVGSYDVAGWSDAAARANTPSVVIDGLRKAAELAEAEGR